MGNQAKKKGEEESKKGLGKFPAPLIIFDLQ